MDMRLQTLLLSCALFPASQSQVIASGPKDPAAKALNQTAKAQSPLLKSCSWLHSGGKRPASCIPGLDGLQKL
jgi:hypothetical protein